MIDSAGRFELPLGEMLMLVVFHLFGFLVIPLFINLDEHGLTRLFSYCVLMTEFGFDHIGF